MRGLTHRALPTTSPSKPAVRRRSLSSGPIPPPETLAKYDEVLEGAANRIITESERQSAHRRAMESRLVTSETRDKVFGRLVELLGLVLAFLAMMGVLAGGVYVATGEGIDSKIVGGLLSASCLIGIVRAFLQGKSRHQERSEE